MATNVRSAATVLFRPFETVYMQNSHQQSIKFPGILETCTVGCGIGYDLWQCYAAGKVTVGH